MGNGGNGVMMFGDEVVSEVHGGVYEPYQEMADTNWETSDAGSLGQGPPTTGTQNNTQRMLTADEKVKELQEILESKNLEMDEMRVHIESSVGGSQQQQQSDNKKNIDQALMNIMQGPNKNSKEIKQLMGAAMQDLSNL